MHDAHGLGSARRVLRYWPIEATAAAGVLDKRELEGRVRHRCTASAVHDAHGLGSARRVLRYWPIEATAAARVLDKRELEGRVRHRCTASAVHDDSMTTARAVKECEGEYAVLEGA